MFEKSNGDEKAGRVGREALVTAAELFNALAQHEMVIVPVEPSGVMVRAGMKAATDSGGYLDESGAAATFRAMVAAAE
ncbi:MAG: hypothetical protein HQL37_02750 [Alphaproteobacteria bacterium]|nr:hypothetical protein [Alphaproteobacteria bacterium]